MKGDVRVIDFDRQRADGCLSPQSVATLGSAKQRGTTTWLRYAAGCALTSTPCTAPTALARCLRVRGGRRHPSCMAAWHSRGMTPLHGAAEKGYVEIAEVLLNSKASMEAKNFNGNTPLHSAVKEGSLEVVRLLVAARAAVDVINADGKTPLQWAQERGHDEVVELDPSLYVIEAADLSRSNSSKRVSLRRSLLAYRK
eukprot:Skav218170  [mRNA]  locus=scaffold5213:141219:149416:- [translate_table: standard]